MSQLPPGPFGPSEPEPEYLDSSGGAPAPYQPPAGQPSKKKAWLIAGGLTGLVLAGGLGAWAASWYLSSGPQPAEALPAGTLAYLSLDIDPSGSQKVEALNTLNRFPAFRDELNLDTDDDLRKRLFDEIQGDSPCTGLEFERDIDSWLGNSAGVALVDLNAEEATPVVVLEVKDQDEAEAGLTKLRNCVGTGSAGEDSDQADFGGWSFGEGFVVLAETKELAAQVTDATEKASLADDDDFQHWTEAAGDEGFVTMYAAPEMGSYLVDHAGDLNLFPSLAPPELDQPMELPAGLRQRLENFQGAAATIRFDDGAVELESAVDSGLSSIRVNDQAGDALAGLPADTVAAAGLGLEAGWFTDFVEAMAEADGQSVDDLIEEASEATGLDLPADAETLLGQSAVLVLGPGLNPEELANSTDPSNLPIAVKIQGDPDGIEAVLDKLRAQAGTDAELLDTDADSDTVVIGPNADYRGDLLADGSLGDTAVFRSVIENPNEVSGAFFINFDGADDWLVEFAGDDAQVRDNLAPLSAMGVSTWIEDDQAHSVLKVTTEE